MQNLSPPYFFQTRTTALHHADLLGLIAPTASMRAKCSFTSSRRSEGIFLGLSLLGFRSVTSILCSAASVHPISPSSNAKMSWYAAYRFRAFSLFSYLQDLRPESSNFLNKIFLLSLMVSSVQPSWAHLWVRRPPTVLSATTVSGTSLVVSIQATAVPFLMTMAWSLVLYSWTIVFWLPQLYLP